MNGLPRSDFFVSCTTHTVEFSFTGTSGTLFAGQSLNAVVTVHGINGAPGAPGPAGPPGPQGPTGIDPKGSLLFLDPAITPPPGYVLVGTTEVPVKKERDFGLVAVKVYRKT